MVVFLLAIPVQSFTSTNALTRGIHESRRIPVLVHPIMRKVIVMYSKLEENDETKTLNSDYATSSPFVLDGIPSLRKRFVDAAAEGFGTKARNVATTMSVGDVVVPLCGNLELRQILANRGIYAGVEYEICSLELESQVAINTMEGVPVEKRNVVTARIKPAYKLRDYLERTDWPVEVKPMEDVPLWLSKTTYEAGTMLSTLGLSLTYVSIAAIIAFFVTFAYVPSPSMQPALNPGDLVLVTRTIWPLRPAVGDVVLFDPPSELSTVVAASAMAQENGASLPTKGQQLLKRVVAKEGEYVGVKNSQPYVDLSSSNVKAGGSDENEGKPKKFRVDIVGPYAQPLVFSESSWNRSPEPLGRNQWFVAGDNGFRSVDSRVWGPLDGKYIYGAARWVVWPLQDFGPIKGGQISTIEK